MIKKFFILILLIVFYPIKKFFDFLIPLKYKAKDISKEIILITGAGNGLGKSLAKKLAKRGATLILVDINEKWNNVTKDEILSDNGIAYAYKCDVSNYEQVKNLAKQIEKNIGNEVTILINNAGVLVGKELLKLSDEEIERLFRINVLSNFWMNKEFLPSMIRKNKGHIVTTASSAGFTGVYRLVDYCTSKHAVYGFHESLTNEIKRLGADKVNTTMICPNYTGTGMCDGVTSPVPILDPEYVTDRMLEGILTNQRLVVIQMIFLK